MSGPGTAGAARPVPRARAEYRATLDRLYRRRRFGFRPGLEVIRAVLSALGEPQRSFPAVHVTGSKGKGSVSAMTAEILSAHGLRVGLFTSPHLTRYAERIREGDRPIPAAAVTRGVTRIEEAVAALLKAGGIDREPTFFEITTALALDWFARRKVDAAVIEVGIGGRLDATNVLDARVGVITTIELEHTDVLGTTLAAIAEEKSGILHPGMRGVIGGLPEEADAVVARTADRLGVSLWRLGREVVVDDRELQPDGQSFSVRVPGLAVPRVRIPLLGGFQVGNAGLAVAAAVRFLDATGRSARPGGVTRGLAHVRWPGRLERAGRQPELFFDVAHTPESARAVTESLGEIAPLADPAASAIVFGCLRGKQTDRILDALSPLARTVVLVPVRSARGLPPSEIRVAAAGRFPRVVEAPNAADGLRLARAATGDEGFTLVTGSDYLVGELREPRGRRDEPDLSDPGHEPQPARGPGTAGARTP